MRHLRFDLNVWLCCTAIAVLIFCVADFIEYATGHLSFPKLRFFFAYGLVGGMLVGFVAQLVLARAGFRLSRRTTDQAEDYDDDPHAP